MRISAELRSGLYMFREHTCPVLLGISAATLCPLHVQRAPLLCPFGGRSCYALASTCLESTCPVLLGISAATLWPLHVQRAPALSFWVSVLLPYGLYIFREHLPCPFGYQCCYPLASTCSESTCSVLLGISAAMLWSQHVQRAPLLCPFGYQCCSALVSTCSESTCLVLFGISAATLWSLHVQRAPVPCPFWYQRCYALASSCSESTSALSFWVSVLLCSGLYMSREHLCLVPFGISAAMLWPLHVQRAPLLCPSGYQCCYALASTCPESTCIAIFGISAAMASSCPESTCLVPFGISAAMLWPLRVQRAPLLCPFWYQCCYPLASTCSEITSVLSFWVSVLLPSGLDMFREHMCPVLFGICAAMLWPLHVQRAPALPFLVSVLLWPLRVQRAPLPCPAVNQL